MPKLTFNKKVDWDQAVENSGLVTADTGVVLSSSVGLFGLADDFNDGVRAPEWLTHLDQVIDLFYFPQPTQSQVNSFPITQLATYKLAQTFTPDANKTVVATALILQRRGFLLDTDTVTLELRNTDVSGNPGSTLNTSVTKQASDWFGEASGLGPMWVTFQFPSPVNLLQGVKYALVVVPNWTPSTSNWAEMTGDGRDLYPGGDALRWDATQSAWFPAVFGLKDFYFRFYKLVPRAKPTESGGFLTFDYLATSGSPDHVHTIRNVAQGGFEFETRFRRRLLSPNFNTGMFSFAILQGIREVVDGAAWEAKVLHEFVMTITQNGIMNWDARIKNQAGQDVFQGSASWPVVANQGMIAPDGQIFTLRVTKNVNGGVTFLLYHSDNPSNVLFQTQGSPVVRTLSGDIFLEIGGPVGTNGAFGSAIDVDYVKLNAPPVEVPTGFLRLRHSFGVKTKLDSLEIRRLIPVVGDKVEIQLRSASTAAGLDSASFGPVITTTPGSFDPGNPQAEFEKALLNLPSAEFWESKIILTRASPSPNLEEYSLSFTPETEAAVAIEEAEPLTVRRHIKTIDNWNSFIEKSSSVAIVAAPGGGGMATLSPVFQDLFDDFVIDPVWDIYGRNAGVFESFDLLRMAIENTDSDAMLVKHAAIPTAFNITTRWRVENSGSLPANDDFAMNVATIFNSPAAPVPNDLRFGGIAPGSHHTVIIRWAKKANGSKRFSFIALRSDGQFVSWNGTAWVTGGAVENVIPAGKEETQWSFELAVTSGNLTIKARDDQGVIRFDTSGQSLAIKIGDLQPWLVLGDSNLDMPVGVNYLYDSVETDIPVTGTTSGFIRFRESLGARGRLGKLKILPTLASAGQISIKARSADSLDDLIAAPFQNTGQFAPDPAGNEVALAVAPAAFFEIELGLFSSSPGPEIFLFTWEIEAVIEDTPLVLSLDVIDPNTQAVSAAINTGQTENQATVPNVKDGDPATQWISTASQEAFGISWTLTLGFRRAGVPVEEIIDTIILRNTNFGRIDVELSKIGFNNRKIVWSGELLAADVILRFDPYLTSNIIIYITGSRTPNEKKTLGEVYAGRLLAVLPNFNEYEPKRELVESGNLRTLGGKLVAYRGRNKYLSRWRVSQVDKDRKDLVEQVFKENPLVSFWPEPKYRSRDLFDVGWSVETIPFAYTDVVKTAGHTLEGEMTEI